MKFALTIESTKESQSFNFPKIILRVLLLKLALNVISKIKLQIFIKLKNKNCFFKI